MAYYICRSVLSSRLATRQVIGFLQPQRFALRKSNPVLFHSSLSRFYTNSTFPSSPPNAPSKKSISSSILNKIGKGFAKGLLVAKVVAGVVSLISVDLLYAGYRNGRNDRLLNKTVEKGTRPEVDVLDDELVYRPLVVDRLKKIFQPDKYQSHYYVVCGEHGTGKTTLTRIASKEVGQDKDNGMQGGMGVIYVEAPPNAESIEDFGIAFGESLNFVFEEHISFTAQLMKKILGVNKDKDERPKWKRALEAFKRASAVYKAKHNKPPVIIYDNITNLINVNPKVLETLQDDAKMNADRRRYIAVFVSSEGNVPRGMESRSSWSRVKLPVIEIGDLSEEESIEYLTKKRKINELVAKKLYELVGGRILELKEVADDFLAKNSLEVIKQSVFDRAEKKFKKAQLYEDQQLHEIGKNVINALLNSKELSYLEYRKVFKSIEKAKDFDPDELLEKNVFAYHPATNTVTFQSQSIIHYIFEKSDLFVKKDDSSVKKSWFFL